MMSLCLFIVFIDLTNCSSSSSSRFSLDGNAAQRVTDGQTDRQTDRQIRWECNSSSSQRVSWGI